MAPNKIVVKDNYLRITWSDNNESSIKLANLRRNCPCALCASENENLGENYIPIYNSEQLTVTAVNIVGNYALGISWKDGHNTGVYIFDSLKKMST